MNITEDTLALITELDDKEKKWWRETIIKYRKNIIHEPKFYAQEILNQKGLTEEQLIENIDIIISETREAVWQLYLLDEAKFHASVLTYLFQNREVPKTILDQMLQTSEFNNLGSELSKDKLLTKVSEVMGEYAGRIFPYLYELSLSTTQSRRSRSGKTFEHLIETLMDIFKYSYDTQSSVGTEFFTEHKLGKKVDLLVPGAHQYIENRAKSAVVTAKTSLRERWQEVAEEISRTNVPHIYLLTVDPDVTPNVATLIKRYNITLVVYGIIKEQRFSEYSNVESFSTFFTKDMPYIIGFWK